MTAERVPIKSGPVVVKLGGAALDECPAGHDLWHGLLDLARSHAGGLIIVHGGGGLVDRRLAALGRRSEKVRGLRATPTEDIGLVVGALAGEANSELVSRLARAWSEAGGGVGRPIGLNLCDGVLEGIEAHQETALGRVGSVRTVARLGPTPPLLLGAGLVPVVASIGMGASGELLNVNADDAASGIAAAAGSPRLIMLSGVSGVLGPEGALLPMVDEVSASRLEAEGVISGGMAAKVRAALDASRRSEADVIICGWQGSAAVAAAASGTGGGSGTVVRTNRTGVETEEASA